MRMQMQSNLSSDDGACAQCWVKVKKSTEESSTWMQPRSEQEASGQQATSNNTKPSHSSQPWSDSLNLLYRADRSAFVSVHPLQRTMHVCFFQHGPACVLGFCTFHHSHAVDIWHLAPSPLLSPDSHWSAIFSGLSVRFSCPAVSYARHIHEMHDGHVLNRGEPHRSR